MNTVITGSAVPSSSEAVLDSRERILRAALSEFAEVGYDAARVDQIALRAKINKAMLYYHFGTKDELYVEAVRHHFPDIQM